MHTYGLFKEIIRGLTISRVCWNYPRILDVLGHCISKRMIIIDVKLTFTFTWNLSLLFD